MSTSRVLPPTGCGPGDGVADRGVAASRFMLASGRALPSSVYAGGGCACQLGGGDSGEGAICGRVWDGDGGGKVCVSSGSGHVEKGNDRGDCGSGTLDEGVGMLCFS